MGWSRENAANAYLDTLKLRTDEIERRSNSDVASSSNVSFGPESNEFISALAAGMSAKLIVEVSPEASQATVALAAAAKQTGGKLVCILPEENSLAASKEVIEESGLKDMVEFKVGDPSELLSEYENIDFSLVDCKSDSYRDLLKLLDVNPRRSVVIANHLEEGKEGICGALPPMNKSAVRSVKYPIGEGMEVTMIGKNQEFGMASASSRIAERRSGAGSTRRPYRKSKWVMTVDEESGEEHIFRIPRSL